MGDTHAKTEQKNFIKRRSLFQSSAERYDYRCVMAASGYAGRTHQGKWKVWLKGRRNPLLIADLERKTNPCAVTPAVSFLVHAFSAIGLSKQVVDDLRGVMHCQFLQRLIHRCLTIRCQPLDVGQLFGRSKLLTIRHFAFLWEWFKDPSLNPERGDLGHLSLAVFGWPAG